MPPTARPRSLPPLRKPPYRVDRTRLPSGLRLGVVTALVGGPFLLWLLRRQPC